MKYGPFDVSITPVPFLLTVPLTGSGAGAGYASFVMKLPGNPALTGQVWFAQWFVCDPAATAGLAASGGTRFELMAH